MAVQILPYATIKFVTLNKKVIAAVDVSKIKIYFILCYWACVLYATHMINRDSGSRKHRNIQEARIYIYIYIYIHMNKSCICKIYQNPERPGLANFLRGQAHIVYKF
jgi:hypothetical protein